MRENENLNHLNKENTSGDNLNVIVGEQKLNSSLYEGLSEQGICNSKTGGNKFIINNYPEPSIKYHFRFQKTDDTFVAAACICWKVDFFHSTPTT